MGLLHHLEYETLNLEDKVEIISLCDNKEMTIGEKRNELYAKANGLYSLQIDDDDTLKEGGIIKILDALQHNPDCVTYQERCIINGKHYRSNHSLKYYAWEDNVDGFDFVRTPYMKDVIRTEIARSIKVAHIRYGEDHLWSIEIYPHLRSEVHLDEEIYYYLHNSSNPEERYGITK